MTNPIADMVTTFGLSPIEAYLFLTVPRFHTGVARGGTTWNRATVQADLRASVAEDDQDQAAIERLIARLVALNVTHIGWYVRGARAMQAGEVIPRPE